ncbi:MAG TPA: VWA domain-containing protein [Marinobacter sp.]|nr:VWA domain-containing protein [Marinobacter sp.]
MTDLHFLRPYWLLALLLLPLIYIALQRLRVGDSGWSRLIPAKLLAPIIRHNGTSGQKRRSPLLPVSIATLMLTIALAGPAWRKAPIPLKQPGDSLVIVLDLSLSMLATDVKPDRLTQAKRKVRDILQAREGSLNGLIVYAADAHVVTPLTDDIETIEGMLQVLDPTIMPAIGNRADLAIARAKTLLEQGAPGKGQILLISDGVAERYRTAIRDLLAGTGITLDTLAVGTQQGGPIPLANHGFIRDNGDIVITRTDLDGLATLARNNGGKSHELTLDNTDIRSLNLASEDQGDWQMTEDGLTVNLWQDDGYWLLWLAAPLLLLGWRRGAFAILALAFLPVIPQPAQAMDWAALWQREDQRAPELIQKDPAQAVDVLKQPEWRGSALYKSGNFNEAVKEFARSDSARANYNRANALAKAGELEDAIKFYDEALAQKPDMEDAQYNRDLVEQLLKQQQEQQQNSPDQGNSDNNQDDQQKNESDQQDQSQKQDNQSESGDNQNSGQQPEQSSDKDQKDDNQGEQSGKGAADEKADEEDQENAKNGQQPEGKEQTSEAEAPAEISEEPLTQEQEQWLRRIPDDPGGLLRRKFLQQYQQRQTPPDEGDTPW